MNHSQAPASPFADSGEPKAPHDAQPHDALAQGILPSSLQFHAPPNASAFAPKRPLLLLFSWMLAKDIHLAKYRTFWNDRGFDVLTIRTVLKDTLLPSLGAIVNVEKVIHFLISQRSPYTTILFHGFSAGNYVSIEFLYALNGAIASNRDPRLQPKLEAIPRAIKGLIMDSITFPEDGPAGTAISLTENPVNQFLIKLLVSLYFTLTYPFTYRHFIKVRPLFQQNPAKYPHLILYSRDDPISDAVRISAQVQSWKESGSFVREKCWTTSAHVQHFKRHYEEYRQEVDDFLEKLDLGTSEK